MGKNGWQSVSRWEQDGNTVPGPAQVAVELLLLLDTRKSDDGWRTMESAPKDGTEVLVYKDVASVPVVHIAWYRSEEEWNESGQHCGGWDTLEEWLGWWSYTRNSVTQERLDGWAEPSHWRPLPSPPEG